MIEYITTQGINHHLEELFENATKEIIIVSPFIQLSRKIRQLLSQKKSEGIEVCFICRKDELNEDLSEYHVLDVPNLHAKCYLNENEIILTSLNLYEYSQINNEEMGFYIKKEKSTQHICSKIMRDINHWCGGKLLKLVATSTPDASVKLKIYDCYDVDELDQIFDFDYKGSSRIKKSNIYGDVVLLSSLFSTYGDTDFGGLFYFTGVGRGEQELKFGNKEVYDAYQDKDRKIHLFRGYPSTESYMYCGEYVVIYKPYKVNGKWTFPLESRIS